MAESIGQIALDIVIGKTSISENITHAISDASKIVSDNSATITNKIDAVGTACSTVGASMLPMSVAVAGVGVAVGKSALDFEDSMAKVSTISDETEVSYDDMKKSIMGLSDQTGISANEIADNVYNAISAGQSTGDAVSFVTNSTKLAKAGFADAGSSLDVLTTIMNAYGLEAGEVNNVSDMLIQTQNLGKTTVGELSSSMGKVIPTANAFGVELDQLCAGYAIMTSEGISTAESTTYMNSMLNELGKSGTGVSDILKEKTGKSFSELMNSGSSLGDVLQILKGSAEEQGLAFIDLWSSSEAGKAGLSLLGESADGFNSTLGEMRNSTGSTDEAFEKLDTTSYTMEKAWNQLKNAGIEIGSVLMQTLGPAIGGICNGISIATHWFSNLPGPVQQVIVVIGLLLAAIGPVLIIFGTLAGAVTTIAGLFGAGGVLAGAFTFITSTALPALGAAFTFLTGPIGIVIAIIGAVIGAGVLLYQNWDTIKVKAGEVGTWIQDRFGEMKEGAVHIFNSLPEGVQSALATLGNVTGMQMGAIKAVFTGDTEMLKENALAIWNRLPPGAQETLTQLGQTAKNGMNVVSAMMSGDTQAMKDATLKLWQGLPPGVQEVLTPLINTVGTKFGEMKNTVVGKFEEIKGAVKGAWDTINRIFSGELSFPKIKLPHFSVSGKFSLNPPSMPNFGVQWYKKGGIMENPTAFGMNGNQIMAGGEAGPEAIVPLREMYSKISGIVDQSIQTIQLKPSIQPMMIELPHLKNVKGSTPEEKNTLSTELLKSILLELIDFNRSGNTKQTGNQNLPPIQLIVKLEEYAFINKIIDMINTQSRRDGEAAIVG